MDYKKIINETLTNGGYTNKKDDLGRYVIAINGFEKVVKVEDFNEKIIKEYVQKNGSEFGTWVFENHVFLDKVEIVISKRKALIIAKSRKEKAIFDLKEMKEIFIEL